MEKSKKILILSNIILIGFAIAIIFHYVLGFYLHLSYPYNTFLFNPNMAYSDFDNLMILIKDFAPFKTPDIWINYFPLAYILLFPFTLIKNSLISCLAFLTIFLSFWIYINIKCFKCKNLSGIENFQNILIISIISYPFLTLFDRGNFDMMLLILMTFFIYMFKTKRYLLSSLILGIVNAIKPFSIIFLFLFLFEKKWKEFFLSVGLSITLIITGFLLLNGDFFNQISVYIANIKLFNQTYVYDINESIQNCSSLFMALKLLFCNSLNLVSTHTLVKTYSIINLLTTAILIFFTWREKVFWKKITLFTLYMLLIPYVIYDYKLIFLFIPLWLFVNTKEKSRFDLIYTILFALLLIPKRFIFINLSQVILFSVVLNPLIIIIIISLIVLEQFYKKEQGNQL